MSGGSTAGGGFLYWARRVRLLLAFTCGLPFLALIVYAGLSSYLGDPADVVVLAPDGAGATVSIDPDVHEALGAGHFGTWKLAKGAHHVRVVSRSGASLQDLDLHVSRGFEKYTVVPLRGQCFAVFDVADAWYGAGARKGLKPKVTARHSDGQAFDLPLRHSFLFTKKTPASVTEGDPVLLLYAVDCDALKKSDAELVAVAGLEEP